MTMNCDTAEPLVPIYMDGELTEARAAPLRRHLLGCPRCRSVAQAETALKGWFVDEESLEIPAGFAARVARRASAGDTGAPDLARDPNPPAGRRSTGTGPTGIRPTGARIEAPLLQFVLQVTAVAAILLIALSIGLHRQQVPEIDSLRADDAGTIQDVLDELDELNHADLDPAEGGDAQPEAEGE